MLYIITLIIVLSISAAFLIDGYNWFDGFIDWIAGVFISIVIFLFGGILGCLIVAGISAVFDTKYVLTHTEKIYSIKDNPNLQGDFILGSGQIKNDIAYFYLTEENGGYKISHVSADDCSLYYTNKENKIKIYEPRFKSKIVRLLFYRPVLSNDHYKMYVPKNTIKMGFSIDMQ